METELAETESSVEAEFIEVELLAMDSAGAYEIKSLEWITIPELSRIGLMDEKLPDAELENLESVDNNLAEEESTHAEILGVEWMNS